MGRQFSGIITGVFILIGFYLVLNRGTNTVNIINALANGSNNAIKTLQGRG